MPNTCLLYTSSASIPFGSRYRQIDFALSIMANSKISNIGIVTKYNYQSLMDHLGNCEGKRTQRHERNRRMLS